MHEDDFPDRKKWFGGAVMDRNMPILQSVLEVRLRMVASPKPVTASGTLLRGTGTGVLLMEHGVVRNRLTSTRTQGSSGKETCHTEKQGLSHTLRNT